ncbi:MAG: imidazole glycerol phosphate synthase subunit HisH [Promethearchaeati archaeon]
MTFYIAIIDYGIGNLKSVSKIITYLGEKSIITSDPGIIFNADGIILPGVGAFGDGIKNLKEKDLISIIHDVVNDNKPLFGICLGMQLLFTKSYEMGVNKGLNLIKGEIRAFNKQNVDKVPQIGWNSVNFKKKNHFLIKGIPDNSYFYFVHSYYCIPEYEEDILGLTQYGQKMFCSMICKENIIGTQFHPEKSSKYGKKIYENFISFCKK